VGIPFSLYVTLDQSSFQPRNNNTLWPVPNYIATEAHVCEQLAQGRCMKVEQP